MKLKRIAFGFLILTLLACNFVTRMIIPPTATPLPTPTFTPTLTPTVTPLAPAFVPPECTSKPVATLAPDAAQAQPTAEADTNPEISTRTQLRVFRAVANTVEEVYVYQDYNGKDWKEIRARYQSKIEAGLDTESFYAEMQAMISELGDEHSFFLSPLEVKISEEELKGESHFVGVGIYGEPSADNQRLVVISTFPGSPAEYAGIKPHDSILKANGTTFSYSTGVDPLRGPECSAVMLTVQSPGEAPRDVLIVRQSIQGGLEIDARLVPTNDGSKIGYIFIPTFFDETIPPQIETALNNFGNLDGLILDVRSNGGGSSSVVNPILEYFTSGRLGKFVSRNDSRSMEVHPNPIQNSQTVPIVVIVSKDTVSFGEIFAGILQDSGRAKVTGETSLGNVEVLHGFDFDDGSELWIAAERFHSEFSDANWEDTGIVPDVQAFAPWDTITFETDPSVAEAVTLLGHK